MNELYDVLYKYRDIIDSFTIWSKTDDMDHNLGRVNENKIRFNDDIKRLNNEITNINNNIQQPSNNNVQKIINIP